MQANEGLQRRSPAMRPAYYSLGAVSIALAALGVYWKQLGFYFTDIDTFALIATSQFESFDDLITVLLSPLMQGHQENALFYRPLASLTWGVDERIWGLDPFGYHLTNLSIHIVNSLLLYALLSQAAGPREAPSPGASRARVEAWLASLLFAIHPITMETVPAIARRPDLLFCLFQLLALFSLARHLRRPRARTLLALAVFCFLGLASKDSAVVLLGVAGVFVLCFSLESKPSRRLAGAVRLCWPLVIVTALFMAQRIAVLGGLGGYASAPATPILGVMKSTFATYMCVIVLPGDLDACQPQLYPLLGASVVVMLLCIAFLFRDFSESATRRVWFSVLVLSMYFALYIVARTVGETRTMYSLLPFLCIPLAWGIAEGARWLIGLRRRRGGGEQAGGIGGPPWWNRALRGVFVAISLLLVVSIVRGVWSGRYLDEWRMSAQIAQRTLSSAARAVDGLSEGSVVYLVNFPYRVSPGRSIRRERPILRGFSVQGWANLAFPEKRLDVIGLSYLIIDGRDPREHDANIVFNPDRRRLDITVGHGVYASPLMWGARPYGKGSMGLATYREKKDSSGLLIDLDREALEGENVAFLVYVGDRVVLRDAEAWSAAHAAADFAQ